MSRLFGWDLPPGCSTNDLPGNEPNIRRAHCKKCGGFLRDGPDHIEFIPGTDSTIPGYKLTFTCRKCGRDNLYNEL